MHAVFIVAVENLHSLDCFGDRASATDEDAIDVESKNKRVCNRRRREWR